MKWHFRAIISHVNIFFRLLLLSWVLSHRTWMLRSKIATFSFTLGSISWAFATRTKSSTNHIVRNLWGLQNKTTWSSVVWTKKANFTLTKAAHTRSTPSVPAFYNKSPRHIRCVVLFTQCISLTGNSAVAYGMEYFCVVYLSHCKGL